MSCKTWKSYNLVDAYAEYAFLNKQLKVFIDVKNIFNENMPNCMVTLHWAQILMPD